MVSFGLALIFLLTCFTPDVRPTDKVEPCVVCASLECPPPPPCCPDIEFTHFWLLYVPMIETHEALARCAGMPDLLFACDG